MCGEKFNLKEMSKTLLGSPPRMRGKVKGCGFLALAVRITPAYAGKSHWESLRRSPPEDHPRVCGEKRSAFPVLPCGWGSPPRMRGKAREVLLHPEAVGITPAYAGKRIKLRKRHSICGDHPCVCGEKIEMPYELLLKEGSPPRMRGKARSRCFVVEVMRITPAYAGKR